MDVTKIKEYIIDNEYVEQILESIDCHHIQYHSNGYWTCGNKDGDNKSAITVYSDTLKCINYTRKMVKHDRATDLIDLVCFNKGISFFEALKFICDIIGIDYYYDFDKDMPESIAILKMLEDMKTEQEDEKEIRLKPIPKKILTYYYPYVNDMFFNDGISYETQIEFSIGYDDVTNRITIPIFSEVGDLVGVKGRLFADQLNDDDTKYNYIEPCAKSQILFGLNKTYPFIVEQRTVFVVESEKAVMQLWTYGYRNVVATGGSTVSRTQMDMLVRLGTDIIFAFDKDISKTDLEMLADKFADNVPIYAILDTDDLLDTKESPSDKQEKWEKLIAKNIIRIK